jgi:hypothetical protein
VIGGGVAGSLAAATAAATGARVLIAEWRSLAGSELTRQWSAWTGQCPPFVRRVLEVCSGLGVAPDRFDPLVTALAWDRVLEGLGAGLLFETRAVRPVAAIEGLDSSGSVTVEVLGRGGRGAVRAERVVVTDAARLFLGGTPGAAVAPAVGRRAYLAGVTGVSDETVVSVDPGLGCVDDCVTLTPAAWPGEALLTCRFPASPAQDAFRVEVGEVFRMLRARVPQCAHAVLAGIAPEPLAAVTPFRSWTDRGFLACEGTLSGESTDDWSRGVEDWLRSARTPPVPASPDPGPGVAVRELGRGAESVGARVVLPCVGAEFHDPVQVVVVGNGTAGAFAATASARAGCSTRVLDPLFTPGGIGTAGHVHYYYHGIASGLQSEVDERVAGVSAAFGGTARGYHPAAKARVLAELEHEAGVQVSGGVQVFGGILEQGRVQAVVGYGAGGYHVFPCEVAIDASGDGDLAAALGCGFTMGREGDGFPQPFSYTPTLMNQERLWHHNFDAGWVDPTDTLDRSRALVQGRRALFERGPFSAEHHYCVLPELLGVRESRFVRTRQTLSFDDLMHAREVEVPVCTVSAHYDNHASDYAQESEWGLRHVVLLGLWRQPVQGLLPFGCLVVDGVSNLVLACRALGVDHDLHQLLRMQRDMQQVGQVAGIAAALAVREGRDAWAVRDLLPGELARQGIVPAVPEPLPDAEPGQLVQWLCDRERCALAMWRLAGRDLEPGFASEAFEAVPGDHERFCLALAAVLAGQCGGAGRGVLMRWVRERRPEPALGVKSPRAFVAAAYALARPGVDDGFVGLLGTALLEVVPDPAETMLLFRALRNTGSPAAGAWIVRAIRVFGDAAAPMPLWGCDAGHPVDFRFSVDLCAVRCLLDLGCDRDAAALLEPYTTGDQGRDPHRVAAENLAGVLFHRYVSCLYRRLREGTGATAHVKEGRA